jgi:hypothetical protein
VSLVFDHSMRTWQFSVGGSCRTLRDPYGAPSARQLLLLAHRGLLEFRDEPGEPLTKLAAAKAIDRTEIVSGRTRTNEDIALEILAVVAECPGANWVEVRSRIRGANVRLPWIRKELALDRRLIVRHEGMRMRLYLPEARR